MTSGDWAWRLQMLPLRGNQVALRGVKAGDMQCGMRVVVLAAALLSSGCTWAGSSSTTLSPTTSPTLNALDPCALLSGDRVGARLGTRVNQVRELGAENFPRPPSKHFVACAYETDGRYGQLILWVQPMGHAEYEARFVNRDPPDARKVHNVGDDARFSGCGSLNVYTNGRVLGLGIQFADCRALSRLVSLARIALTPL
jgi:hypothetical protein